MKDLSAGLMGLLPALILWRLGAIEHCVPEFFYAGTAAICMSLIIYYILHYWRHPAILSLLTLGFPLIFYVFVAVRHPLFLGLFYAVALLVVLAGCLGALVAGTWSWQEVASNIAFFCTVLLVAAAFGKIELVYAEAGVLAAGAFGITRICQVDLVGWLMLAPRWIYKGLEKIWY